MGTSNPKIQKSQPLEQESLMQSLQDKFIFKSNAMLIDKQTHDPYTLYKVTGYTKQQSLQIQRTLSAQRRSSCQSIMKMRENYRIQKDSYCSNQQTYYCVFQGNTESNLKLQFQRREKNRQYFSPDQIINVVSCVLCALREYSQNFKRKQISLQLSSIIIDRSTNKLSLEDPWLPQNRMQVQSYTNNRHDSLINYPSPEKIKASYSALQQYDQRLSDLFSAGIIGIMLSQRQTKKSSLYSSKFGVNQIKIDEQLHIINHPYLRSGLQILLSHNPSYRQNIYQHWGVSCANSYHLNSQKQQNITNLNIGQPFTQHNYSKHNIHNQPLNIWKISQCQSLNKSLASNSFIPHYEKPYNIQRTQHSKIKINSNNNDTKPWISSWGKKNYASYQQPMQTNNFSRSKVNFTVQKQPIYNSPNNWKNEMGITQTQSRLKPISVVSPLRSQKRYSSLQVRQQSHSNTNSRSNSPNPHYRDRNQPMKTSLQLQNNYQQIGVYHHHEISNKPGIHIRQIKTDRTSTTHNSQQYHNPRMQYNNEVSTNNIVQNGTKFVPQFSMPANHNQFNYPTYRQTAHEIMNYNNKGDIDSHSQNYKINQSENKRHQIVNYNNGHKTVSPAQSPQISSKISSSPQSPIYNQLGIVDQLRRVMEGDHVQNTEDNYSLSPSAHQQPYQQRQQRPISPNIIKEVPNIVRTPEQRKRLTHRYNSTIVQVNEQTPRSSDGSHISSQGQIQYTTEQYETGSKFTGFKKNGQKTNRGKFQYADGGYYDGNWKHDKMDGWGKLYYQNGKLAYEGNWSQGQFDGYGKVFNDNPIMLKQAFDYSNFDYLGDYWQQYQGMFSKDTKQGRGRIAITNGQIFEGDFHNDKIQGFGKFLTTDGVIIQGIWRDSRLLKILNN